VPLIQKIFFVTGRGRKLREPAGPGSPGKARQQDCISDSNHNL